MRLENGYYLFPKGTDALLSYHFKADEFSCRCQHPSCLEQKISASLVEKLERVRVGYGRPITIHSGFRCSAHQADLRASGLETAKGTSQHELGRASDVAAGQMTVLVPLLKAEFMAMGLARTWAHVDLRDDKHRSWTYR
jgi:hypothetical protein